MLRRVWIAVGLLLTLLPAAVFAQDSRALWNLTQTISVADIGIEMSYPEGWLHDGGESGNGITFAATQADIDAQADDDNTTFSEGLTLNILGIPLESAKEIIGGDVTLESVLDFAAQSAQITETEQRVEIPVMGRRTLTLIGNDASGRAGFATVWQQGDLLVFLKMQGPDMDTVLQAAYSYGQVMSSIVPMGAEELGDNTITLPNSGLQIPYPKKWYPGTANNGTVFQLKSDLTAETPEGALMIFYEEDAEGIGLGKDATVADYADYTITYYGLGEPRREEFIINGQPALTLRGTDGSSQYGLVTVTLQGGIPVTLAVIANTEDELNTLEPTWNGLLKAISFAQS